MTRDDIIRMAREVGYPIQYEEWEKATEQFAALVAAAEREALAKHFEKPDTFMYRSEVAAAIRARGQQ